MIACSADKASPAPAAETGTIVDLTGRTTRQSTTYRPKIDEVNIHELSLLPPQGGPLYLHHPVALQARVEVKGEPMHEDLWYGLKSDNANAHCVVGHVDIDHLAEAFQLSSNATQSLAQRDAVEPPSLTDCTESRTCATEGEECMGFMSHSGDLGPDSPLPTGNEPDTAPVTETVWQCSTRSWASTLQGRVNGRPPVVSPADLTGSQSIEHIIGETNTVPDTCAALVGAADLAVWVAFDPEGNTDFAQRPVYAGPEATVTDDQLLDEQAFEQLMPGAVRSAEQGLQADPGLDVSLMHVGMATSVVELSSEDQPGGDLALAADVSIDGTPTEAQQAALATSSISFAFTLEPTGSPRAGCEPPSPLPADLLKPVALPVIRKGSDGTPTEVATDALTEVNEGVEHERGFSLHIPADLRARIYSGDLRCWDTFRVSTCLTSSVPEVSGDHLGDDDNCQTTDLVMLRRAPSTDGTAPPPSSPPPPDTSDLEKLWGNISCDQNLLKEYANKRKLAQEYEDQTQIQEYYTYDLRRTIMGLEGLQLTSFVPTLQFLRDCLEVCTDESCYQTNPACTKRMNPGNAPSCVSPFTNIGKCDNDNSRMLYYQRVLGGVINCLRDCDQAIVAGGDPNPNTPAGKAEGACVNSTPSCQAPPGVDAKTFNGKVFYWAQELKKIKASATDFAKNSFNSNCEGISSGSVCSEIGYDLTRINELGTKLAAVRDTFDRYSAFSEKASGTAYWKACPAHLYALKRFQVDPNNAKITDIPDDNAFTKSYLTNVCGKAKALKDADGAWTKIQNTCTYTGKPFNSAQIVSNRFIPDLYKTYTVGDTASLTGTAEGGILTDYVLDKVDGRFKFTFGAQARVYITGNPNHDLLSAFTIEDIFKAWARVNLASNVVDSNVDLGFHVLTKDIWKVTARVPDGEFDLPSPPELSKEKEKCKYLFKPPIPVRLELCGAIGGKVSLSLSAQIGRNDIDANGADRPGAKGIVTPAVAMTTAGRVGIDYWVGSAGVKLTLDPTVEIALPLSLGTTWDIKYDSAQKALLWDLRPFVSLDLTISVLGGEVGLYQRLKFKPDDEKYFKLFDWDAIEVYNTRLFYYAKTFTGSTRFDSSYKAGMLIQ